MLPGILSSSPPRSVVPEAAGRPTWAPQKELTDRRLRRAPGKTLRRMCQWR
jgi:hypothetical protein